MYLCRAQRYEKKLKRLITDIIKVALPLFLGTVILYWTYRDFDFSTVSRVLWHQMDWMWMLASSIFGVTAQLFRGWRWRLTLEPMGEYPQMRHCVNSIFVSYAANLLIPRVGEVSRCGLLKQFDGVSFSKSLGTVVTERIIDTLCVLLITGLTLFSQMSIFGSFFQQTGVNWHIIQDRFTDTHFIILGGCLLAIGILLIYLLRRLAIFARVKATFLKIFEGVVSVGKVRNIPLFLLHTAGIWGSYILHFYLTFYAFSFTSQLSFVAGLVLFAVGSLAVIVPTPNGAGPWHFTIIVMLTLYGVGETQAEVFALLVHAIQTLLIIVLGIWGMLAFSIEKRKLTK